MLSFHVKGVLAAIVAGVAAGLIGAAAAGRVQAGWVVAAVLAVFLFMLSAALIRCRRVTYTITNRRLSIVTGLVARDVHETRLEQIQNVNITQSLLDRVLDVGTIAFDTAGGASFEFSFRGVTAPRLITRTIDQALHERVAPFG
jgi:uncharacterized membrane protein YdbT with pleckstrin-like domain